MKKKKKKKYDFGGKIVYDTTSNHSYIDDPYELIAQRNINWIDAKRDVASNPLLQGGKMLGGALKQTGVKMLGTVAPGADQIANLGLQGFDMYNKSQGLNTFGNGGTVNDALKNKNIYKPIYDSRTGQQFASINMKTVSIPQKKKIIKKKSNLKRTNSNNNIENNNVSLLQKEIVIPEENVKNFNSIINEKINSNPYNKKIRHYSRGSYNTDEDYQEQLQLQNDYLQSPIMNEDEYLNSRTFAMGGKVPVEVEGNEAFELPNGVVGMFNGPSHEQGGIDTKLPAGTDIYSDRISIDGKTMAQRKASRERKIKSVSKKIEKTNGSDQILKNTHSRLSLVNMLEDEKDMQIQEAVKQSQRKFKFGGKIKAAYGFNGIGPANSTEYQDYLSIMNPQYKIPFMKNPDMLKLLGDKPLTTDNTSFGQEELSLPNYKVNPALDFDPAKQQKTMMTKSSPIEDDNSAQIGGGLNIGDMLGIGSNFMQGYLPYLNTLNNRAEDNPNINFHKNYGKKTLEIFGNEKGYVKQLRDNALSDLNLTRTSTTKKMRNSARSINTQRALDLTANQSMDRSQNDVYDKSTSQMMNIMDKEANANLNIDGVVANAQKQKDIEDRQDRDNFNTQHARDLVNLMQGVGHTGKSLNDIKERDTIMKVLGDKNNTFYYDADGNLKIKKKKR